MLENLNWENYLSLNDFIRTNNFLWNYFSTIQLVQWTSYGFDIKFHKTNDYVLFYLYKKTRCSKWCLMSSYYKPDINIAEIKKVIKNDLDLLNGNDGVYNFIDLDAQEIKLLQLENESITISPYISNYIYELDKMATMSGKKLQKKRNHLNAFLKENYDIKIVNFRDVDSNEILEFCKYHINKYAESFRGNEFDSYEHLLKNEVIKDERYVGILIYIDGKIVGFTLGFINYDVFEVLIEKAERDIRGLYQYLIVKNIETNQIKAKFMDREDDAGTEELAKSKKSYHPIAAVERFCVNNIKNWFI